ncbi:MAG: cupin domain-containing protein [Chloroflexi bacterium]|nr:cupin domain-containing protein [Chloroflexota bacterium]
MVMPVSVNKFEAKSHDAPDEARTPDKTRVDIVRLEKFTMGRLSFEPGWRWSECLKPVVGGDACQVSHVGYAVSGRLTILLPDGSQRTINSGDSYTIPPGHDAWVEGAAPYVGIEVMSAEQYAQSRTADR